MGTIKKMKICQRKFKEADFHYHYYCSFSSFSHECYVMVSHWSLSDRNSFQVSRILLSILADLNSTVVWVVSNRPLISSLCINPLVSVAIAPIAIGIIVTYVPQFFQFPSKIKVLILLFAFFQFYSVVIRYSKVQNLASSLFFQMSDRLARIR